MVTRVRRTFTHPGGTQACVSIVPGPADPVASLASAYDVGADLEMIGSAVAADTDVEPGSAEFSLILAIVGVLVQEPRNLDALAQGSTPEPACYETLIDIAEAYPESPARLSTEVLSVRFVDTVLASIARSLRTSEQA